MIDVEEELFSIKQRIREYRFQKEDEFQAGNTSGTTVPSSLLSKGLLMEMNKKFTRFSAKEDLMRFFDVDCILSPYVPLIGGEWPSALISSSVDKCADLGAIDSHGSLFRLIRKDLGLSGTHVIIQSSEIGEKSLYLSSNLSLTSDLSSAAIWTVKIQENDYDKNEILKPTTAFGLLIQLVLINRKADGSIDLTCFDNEQSSKHKYLVAAKANSGSGEKGVAVLTESDRLASDETFSWALTWQITREDNTIDGFAFLDSVELDYNI
jgi:hypothetical protein